MSRLGSDTFKLTIQNNNTGIINLGENSLIMNFLKAFFNSVQSGQELLIISCLLLAIRLDVRDNIILEGLLHLHLEKNLITGISIWNVFAFFKTE